MVKPGLMEFVVLVDSSFYVTGFEFDLSSGSIDSFFYVGPGHGGGGGDRRSDRG